MIQVNMENGVHADLKKMMCKKLYHLILDLPNKNTALGECLDINLLDSDTMLNSRMEFLEETVKKMREITNALDALREVK